MENACFAKNVSLFLALKILSLITHHTKDEKDDEIFYLTHKTCPPMSQTFSTNFPFPKTIEDSG